MKILLTSIGTRGDIEPFLAIGEMLLARGHEVIGLFPEQFRDLTEDTGLRFASLGSEFIQMLDSEEGKAALGGGGSGLRKFIAYVKLAVKYSGMNKAMLQRQYELIEAEQPDRILHNGKAMYPIIWGLERPGRNILLSPVPYLYHVVNERSHVAFHNNYGPFLNRLTYRLGNFGLIQTVMTSIKWLGLPRRLSSRQLLQAFLDSKIVYTVSPTLFPRPDYWPDNARVLGYHERRQTTHWQPPAELEAFVKRHDQLLLVTFGSMTNPQPAAKTRIILDILRRHRIPAIINTAAGGLAAPDDYERELFHFVDRIPYDWAFPRLHAVIHHGGSGTTHTALRHGCAGMIVPHIIDQFVWNNTVARLGAGPQGPSINRLSTAGLEPKILDLMRNPAYKETAEAIARRMQAEELAEELLAVIED